MKLVHLIGDDDRTGYYGEIEVGLCYEEARMPAIPRLDLHTLWNARNLKDISDSDWQREIRRITNLGGKNGIHIWTFGNMGYPYYIGRCTAVRWSILTPVWGDPDKGQGLSGYHDGTNGMPKCWIPHRPSELEDLTCLKRKNNPRANHFADTWVPQTAEEKRRINQAIDELLDGTSIVLSKLEDPGHGDVKECIIALKIILQNNVYAHFTGDDELEHGWIGDKGRNFGRPQPCQQCLEGLGEWSPKFVAASGDCIDKIAPWVFDPEL